MSGADEAKKTRNKLKHAKNKRRQKRKLEERKKDERRMWAEDAGRHFAAAFAAREREAAEARRRRGRQGRGGPHGGSRGGGRGGRGGGHGALHGTNTVPPEDTTPAEASATAGPKTLKNKGSKKKATAYLGHYRVEPREPPAKA
ncbi:hypothetical protein N7540_008698 [Penicillium herquei]|nr:hypothetical protein N7540_008698 [Penicillium herquei]